MYTNNTSGLAAVATQVAENFNIKTYTAQMLQAIEHPSLDNLTQIQEAYAYFTAMVGNQSFTTSTGQVLDFSALDPALKQALDSKATKALKDFNTINVPYDAKGDVTPLLNSDGSKTSLYDLVSNPNASYHVNFKLNANDTRNDENSAAWTKNPAGGDFDRDFNNEDGFWTKADFGATDHFGVGDRTKYDLQASVSHPACKSDLNCSISGTATNWEKSGALQPSTSDAQAAANDAQDLENFLQNNM